MKEKTFNKNDYDNKFKKEKYDRLNCLLTKGTKERIQKAADKNGVTCSEYMRQAITEKLEKDNV